MKPCDRGLTDVGTIRGRAAPDAACNVPAGVGALPSRSSRYTHFSPGNSCGMLGEYNQKVNNKENKNNNKLLAETII